MDTSKNSKEIFMKSSSTFYFASLLFPKEVRSDIFDLYAFVRTADDFIDKRERDLKGFNEFKSQYFSSISAGNSENSVIRNFINLSKNKKFDTTWTESFFNSMEMDVNNKVYETIEDVCNYTYGSAEVIGLMLSKIFDIPENAFPQAQKLGRAYQFINMVRDIGFDLDIGRVYIPKEDLNKFNLEKFEKDYLFENKEKFKELIRFEIKRFETWLKDGEEGYEYICKKFLKPIKIASELYRMTASEIANDPMVVLYKKIKPSKLQFVKSLLK